MSIPKLERLFISEAITDRPELRVDWSNDHHHAAMIGRDMTVREVAKALRVMADLIERDPGMEAPNA